MHLHAVSLRPHIWSVSLILKIPDNINISFKLPKRYFLHLVWPILVVRINIAHLTIGTSTVRDNLATARIVKDAINVYIENVIIRSARGLH